MDNNSKPLFLMHIMDGYSFRNMIAVIKAESEYTTMVLSERSIDFSFPNTSTTAIHKITLQPQDFIMYNYNIRGEDGELYKEFPVAFETASMFNTTKNIGRKDSIRLYWLSDDNKIYVQPIKTNLKDPGRAGALFVNIETVEYVRYDIGVWSDEPNIRVQAKDFAEICTQANTMKCSSLELMCQESAMTLRGIRPSQSIAFVNRFVSQTQVSNANNTSISNILEIDDILKNIKPTNSSQLSATSLSLKVVSDGSLITVRTPIATVKALSKIHNIGPAGSLVRFYFNKGKALKMEFPVGNYGKYTICLFNSQA